MVNQAKSPATCLRRPVAIADHVVRQGKTDFKALLAEIKKANHLAKG